MANKRGTPQRPSLCIFCDRIANSPEHLWSDWMAKHYVRKPHDYALETNQRFHPDPQPEPVITKLHGHVVTRKHKVVCRVCNTGWMSGLETPAKLALEPMLLGKHVELNSALQKHLTNWIVLKLMVLERRKGAKPAFSRDEALQFREYRKIPDNVSIDLFYTIDDRLRSVLHRESAAIPPEINPLPSFVVTNLQAVTLGIGRLMIYARHARLSEFGFKKFSANISRRLWPDPAETILWPPPINLSFDDVQFMNQGLARFLAPMTPV